MVVKKITELRIKRDKYLEKYPKKRDK